MMGYLKSDMLKCINHLISQTFNKKEPLIATLYMKPVAVQRSLLCNEVAKKGFIYDESPGLNNIFF